MKSNTSNSSPSATSVQYVKGVGPSLGGLLASRGIRTVRDLITFFPRAYEDRSELSTIEDLPEGETASVPLTVLSHRWIPIRRKRTRMLEVRASDATGIMSLKWFHVPRGLAERLKEGTQFIATGKAKRLLSKKEMIHPEIALGQTSLERDTGRIVPIYTEIEGIQTRVLRKILWNALETYGPQLEDDLPPSLCQKYGFPDFATAIRAVHFPDKLDESLLNFRKNSQIRLIFEEFFKFEYLILREKLKASELKAPPLLFRESQSACQDLEKILPFQLTEDQQKACREILEDLALPHPMNRLVQGDVGSGKTAVAFLAAGAVLAQGGQAALMAPTEILAEQHYKNAVQIFGGRLNVKLLTGSTSESDRAKLLGRLQSGEPTLLIGTHALIEDSVVFHNLLFVMIDEQHRFGVEQRKRLRDKGPKGLIPHSLVLTATPIPRTLALTAYGDLSVSNIHQMPPGRKPVHTFVVPEKWKARAYQRIREEIKKGRQAYFIFPLVNDSEAEKFKNMKSAVSEHQRLQESVFPDLKIALLHGQMKSDEKAQVMDQFKRGEFQILVSTTVVEVGVDVPNSTVMVIEHADRFGLSQLHQLRGRVGRGEHQSICFLFTTQRIGQIAMERLKVMEKTNDGFEIAEADLQIRGPGEFLGTRQSGGLAFRMADLLRDAEWLIRARDEAITLLQEDAELATPQLFPLRRFLEREGARAGARFHQS